MILGTGNWREKTSQDGIQKGSKRGNITCYYAGNSQLLI